MDYPNYGFSVDGRNLPRTCPKCDEKVIRDLINNKISNMIDY
jgi:hypothetical protein